MKALFMVIFVCLGCMVCTASHALTEKQRIANYTRYSQKHLSKDFQQAGLTYPSKRLALLIFKHSKRLELYASNGRTWHYIKTFPITAASGGPGPKLHSGDYQVPEGVYRIIQLNPYSHYFLSMELNYPNAFDRKEARIHHHYHLGDNIFIHGENSSVGCIAIGNQGIEELYPLVSAVGIDQVKVIIAPDDLRYKKPIYGEVRPPWLQMLYHRIYFALEDFPLHSRV